MRTSTASWSICSRVDSRCHEEARRRRGRSRRRWRQLWRKTEEERTGGWRGRTTRRTKCFVSTAGSLVTVCPTVQRLTETRKWAEGFATAAAPPNTRSRNAGLKWTRLWVITRLLNASSVGRRDICLGPVQIILKDFMHKAAAVEFVAQWNIFRRTVRNTRLRRTQWPFPGSPTTWAQTTRTSMSLWPKPNPNRLK